MERPTLVLGSKNYSSWSMRAWIALVEAGVDFDEVVVPLDQPESSRELRRWSPTARVPVLRFGDRIVWDSLAIAEWAAEHTRGLWPDDDVARAVARSASAEMHAGFSALRQNMPMNIRRSSPGKGRAPGVDADIARIETLWGELRRRFGDGGDMLFGRFSIADAMFAPVATRFRTYDVSLGDEVATAYAAALLARPSVVRWIDAATAEPWTSPSYDL